MMTPAVVATLWKLIYHPTIGPLNYTLSLIGIKAPEWATSEFALPALVVADVWQWTPFMTILLLAGRRASRARSTRRPTWTAPRAGRRSLT